MKSETVITDRIKEDRRHLGYLWKMSKISPFVNGADDFLSYAADEESLIRQINLPATFHDHISCTKSTEFRKIDGTRERRASLPCQTDHIYASDFKRLTDISPIQFLREIRHLKKLLFNQLELIRRLEQELVLKNKQIRKFKKEVAMLRARFDQRDRVILRKKHKIIDKETHLENSSPVIENTALSPVVNNNDLPAISTPPLTPVPEAPVAPYNPNTISSINLVTRYFGRKSKTIPSRALKRRYLGPPKTIPCQTVIPRNLSSTASFSSTSVHKEVVPKPETPKVTIKPEVERTTFVSLKKVKKQGKKSKGISQKIDFLTTDKPYHALNNYSTSNSPLVIRGDDIHVPLWELKPVTSFYQMEGTENINDDVFQRRHMKYELDEKRRKRWDIQRLREQKASEKLKNKYCKKVGKEPEDPLEKVQTLHPDPQHVQYIQYINQLPVLAFGHLIPLFQPSEFSLTWKPGDRSKPIDTIPAKVGRKNRQSSSIPKVT